MCYTVIWVSKGESLAAVSAYRTQLGVCVIVRNFKIFVSMYVIAYKIDAYKIESGEL